MPTVYPKTSHGRASDYVAVPRKTFEEFLMWQRHRQNKAKSFKVSKPTVWEQKIIKEGERAIKSGNYITLEKLKGELGL